MYLAQLTPNYAAMQSSEILHVLAGMRGKRSTPIITLATFGRWSFKRYDPTNINLSACMFL